MPIPLHAPVDYDVQNPDIGGNFQRSLMEGILGAQRMRLMENADQRAAQGLAMDERRLGLAEQQMGMDQERAALKFGFDERELALRQRKYEDEVRAGQALTRDLGELFQEVDAGRPISGSRLDRIIAAHPQLTEALKPMREKLTKDREQQMLSQGSQLYGLLNSGDVDRAKAFLVQSRDAYRNAGDEGAAATAQSYLDMLDVDPSGKQAMVGLAVNMRAVGKDAVDNLFPEPTSDVKNYEYAQENPEFAAYQEGLRKAGGAKTTVNVGAGEGGFPSKVAEEIMKKDYGAVIEKAGVAENMLPKIRQLEALVKKATSTGPAQKLIPKELKNKYVQEMNALVSRMVEEMRIPGSGSQSDFEMVKRLESFPNDWMEPGVNEKIVNRLHDNQKRAELAGRIVRAMAAGRFDSDAKKNMEIGQNMLDELNAEATRTAVWDVEKKNFMKESYKRPRYDQIGKTLDKYTNPEGTNYFGLQHGEGYEHMFRNNKGPAEGSVEGEELGL